jgi:DNA polymerase III delta prime subunit
MGQYQIEYNWERYVMDLINTQQNINNNFVNITSEELYKLAKKANTYDMSESEIIEMILDLKYA